MLAVIPCLFIVLTIAALIIVPHTMNEAPAPSSKVWSGAFVTLLGLLALGCFLGNVEANIPALLLVSAVLSACAISSLWNKRIRQKLAELKGVWPQVLEALFLLIGAYLTFIAIELPSNPQMTQFWWEGLIIENVIILMVMTTLHFLFQRSGVGATLAAVIFELFGIAEYFVVTFKNTPIMASDVLALGTAAAVGGGYSYILDGGVLLSCALLAFTILLLSFTPLPHPTAKKRAVLLNIAASLVVGTSLVLGCIFIDFANTFGVTYNAWIPLVSYWREGFVTSFITQVQSFKPEQPRDYSNERAEALLATYAQSYDETLGASKEHIAATAQFDEEQPTVIVIMNESFADLAAYDDLAGTYNGPQWFNSFDGALAKGTLYVSPYGGGTCNSEWEFLTGASMAFMGSGVYPYMVYDMTGVQNLAATFKGLGYTTTAMHPNLATNWYRNVVYPTLGFDTFLDISDFSDAERLRNMVTDAATYDKILDLLKSSDDPQFIFDVTMQNHGGYATGALPADMVINHTVKGYSSPELDEYLALIDESDRALRDFITSLSTLDRKVVVVFFGDHQPSLASSYNDLLMTQDSDSLTHEERARTTSYMIYANYDVAGAQTGVQRDSSTNYLAADMMQLVGAPLTDYQKAELVMRSGELPLVNLLGYADGTGTWHDIRTAANRNATSGAAKLRNDLQVLQYHQLFANGIKFQTGSGYSGTVWGRLN